MFYILFKDRWAEHFPDYLDPNLSARIDPTLPGKGPQNTKAQRFPIVDGNKTLAVWEIMSKNIKEVDKGTDIPTCKKIMAKEGIHHLVVKDNGKFCGIVSDRDLALVDRIKNLSQMNVAMITTTVVLAASESATVGGVALVLHKERISSIPVLNEDLEVVGIITISDMLKLISRTFM